MGYTTDESTLANKQTKRRIMEAQGGEVRRIHIIYYLSRKGRIEHPHLIRVHHLTRNGVHLRDVKRWLAELRGKDVADSFAWSFKRRYKKGFLWQDLVDEDLITPISDNEYVLKGSEISSTFINDLTSYGEEKELIMQELLLNDQIDNKSSVKEQTDENQQVITDDSKQNVSEIEEPTPVYSTQTSTATEDSVKLEEHEDLNTPKEEENRKGKFENESVYANQLNKRELNSGNNSNASTPNLSASFDTPPFTKSKKTGSKLRSLISCKGVDTVDSTTTKISKYRKISTTLSRPNYTTEICNLRKGVCEIKREQVNGRRKSWKGVEDSKRSEGKFSEQKRVSAAYRPIHGPNCSQCGREFKPEKLHKHMKSCRGMKAFAKSAKTSIHTITTPVESSNQDLQTSYYYLTQN